MPFNYKAISMVKEALFKRAGSFVPKSIYSPDKKTTEVHPAIPGKATGRIEDFPKENTLLPASKNFISGAQTLKFPEKFREDSDIHDKYVKRNYYPGINRKDFGYAIRDNLSTPEERAKYLIESRRLANLGLKNRLAHPTVINYANNPRWGFGGIGLSFPFGLSSDGHEIAKPVTNRLLNLSTGTMDPKIHGATMAHELEHAGGQFENVSNYLKNLNEYNKRKGLPEKTLHEFVGTPGNLLPNNLLNNAIVVPDKVIQYELPAVLAEFANQAQAAYAARGNKPLSGKISISPDDTIMRFPLEEFRKQVERRGHVGGEHNVSMTDLLNSPDGQEFLRMNFQNQKIRDAQNLKRKILTEKTLKNSPGFENTEMPELWVER